MGRAFEYRKAAKLKRWGNMARTFTRIGKQIAIAVKGDRASSCRPPHCCAGDCRLRASGCGCDQR